MDYIGEFISDAVSILQQLDQAAIQRVIDELVQLRSRKGRLFFLGVGGGAGHASHAVNDFRKIANFEAYTPTDNVSELTARVNDDGWETAYAQWLRGSRLGKRDMVFVFSVGGGDAERNISANLVSALRYAREVGAAARRGWRGAVACGGSGARSRGSGLRRLGLARPPRRNRPLRHADLSRTLLPRRSAHPDRVPRRAVGAGARIAAATGGRAHH